MHEQLEWLGYAISAKEIRTQTFGATTKEAVRAFQVKHWMDPNGQAGKGTRKKLDTFASPIGVLPRRCTEVDRAICIDKTTKLLRYVRKGKVVMTLDARFGAPGMETGEGTFQVNSKSRNHTSSKYRTWMPFAMFFNGDEAVHYSPDFASVGYIRGSHGCVGVRNIEKAEELFDMVPEGTRVYVYWS